MAKFNLKKGDLIYVNTPIIRSESAPYNKIGGGNKLEIPLKVVKVFSSGVSTKERGFVHNNNIISKETKKL